MTDSIRSDILVRVAESHERERALRLVLTSDARTGPTIDPQVFLRQASDGHMSLDRLLVAQRRGELVGASWANLTAGRCAAIWVPRLVEGEMETAASHLLGVLQEGLVRDGVYLAQALLAPNDRLGANRLSRHGFRKAADLEYLACSTATCSQSLGPSPLSFEPYRPHLHGRFAEVVELTYQGTRDCPDLNGLRDTQDVLDGYMHTGQFHPDHWLLAQHQQAGVGCLLLADHKQHKQLELVYMGLIPSARGFGWGRLLVLQAQRIAGELGRQRVVLAVDANNRPAIDIYAAAGFVRCDQWQVFIKDLRVRQRTVQRIADEPAP